MKFVALGRTGFLYDTIQTAVERGHQCVLIGNAEPAEHDPFTCDRFVELAGRLGCRYLPPSSLATKSGLGMLWNSAGEVALSVNWPTMLKRDLRRSFTHGVINAHAGDVPRYRGNACPNWAILNGESEVVLSFFEMDDGLDTGPVYLKKRLALGEETSITDIYDWLGLAVPEGFVGVLDAIEQGTIPTPQPTDPSLALRCYPRVPEDGLIDWNRSATEIHRLIRASGRPFCGAFSHLNGRRLTIWRASRGPLPCPSLGVPGQVIRRDNDTGGVDILCGEDKVTLQEVSLDDQAPASRPSAILSSLRMRLR